jgi:hypothetical protein
MEAVADRHAQAVALAREAGVTVSMGTDIAMTDPDLPDSWGRNGRELGLLVDVGFTALEVIGRPPPAARTRWVRRRRDLASWCPITTPMSSPWTPTR